MPFGGGWGRILHAALRRDAFRASIRMAELIRQKLTSPASRGTPRSRSKDPLLKVAGACFRSDFIRRHRRGTLWKSERLFVDTWGWLVRANQRDPVFPSGRKVRERDAMRPYAWVTTDYVRDETMTRLFTGTSFVQARKYMGGIFDASREGLLDIEHVTSDRFTAAWRLRLRYQDTPRISVQGFHKFRRNARVGNTRGVNRRRPL